MVRPLLVNTNTIKITVNPFIQAQNRIRYQSTDNNLQLYYIYFIHKNYNFLQKSSKLNINSFI